MLKSKPIPRVGAGVPMLLSLLLTCGVPRAWSLEITSPMLRDGQLVLTVSSEVGQDYTLQAAEAVAGPWQDLASQPGTGGALEFSDSAAGSQRFYRVLASSAPGLELLPAEPLLTSGAVSLPDAVAGSAYSQAITVDGGGPGGFTLELSGDLPPGVTFMVEGNGTPEAILHLTAEGAGLAAGERREFAVRVTGAGERTATRSYNLRVVAAPPVIETETIELKAGEAVDRALASAHGDGPLTWIAPAGSLPEGVSLAANGTLSGTPTAAAAEANETGLFTVEVEVADSHTDRVTNDPTPRTATKGVTMLVRLSYQLNLRASRPGGPSLGQSCAGCHGPSSPPNVAGGASGLIERASQPFSLCASRVYVRAGSPSESLLYSKLSAPDCGSRMPQGGPFMNAVQLGRVERWIRELTELDTD